MASSRVEHMLDEIARLSGEEQAELLQDLPRVLRSGGTPGRLSIEAVRQAVATRERIRRRLDEAAVSPGSINADLDEIRDDRLEELLDGTSMQDQVQ